VKLETVDDEDSNHEVVVLTATVLEMTEESVVIRPPFMTIAIIDDDGKN